MTIFWPEVGRLGPNAKRDSDQNIIFWSKFWPNPENHNFSGTQGGSLNKNELAKSFLLYLRYFSIFRWERNAVAFCFTWKKMFQKESFNPISGGKRFLLFSLLPNHVIQNHPKPKGQYKMKNVRNSGYSIKLLEPQKGVLLRNSQSDHLIFEESATFDLKKRHLASFSK